MVLCRTWAFLIGLSLASTGLASLINRGAAGQAVMAVIIALAWIKAHLILRDYLRLARSPVILRGFDIALGLAMMAMLGLGLAG